MKMEENEWIPPEIQPKLSTFSTVAIDIIFFLFSPFLFSFFFYRKTGSENR